MWNIIFWLMLILYIPSCLGLIVVVLLQKGKGVGFAGAFGVGGGSDTVFGPRTARSLPQRLTYAMATLFMVLALLMTVVYGRTNQSSAPDMVDATGSSVPTTTFGGSTMPGFFGNQSDAAEDTTTEEAAPEAAPEAAVIAPVVEEAAEDAPAAEAAAEVAVEDVATTEDAATTEEAPAEETPAETPAQQ